MPWTKLLCGFGWLAELDGAKTSQQLVEQMSTFHCGELATKVLVRSRPAEAEADMTTGPPAQ